MQKLLVKMKDDSEGKIIDQFIGLRSKMYSILSDDGKESNTTKGVNIATEFKETLFSKKVVRHQMRRIQSKKQINKISLLCFEDKRFVLNDWIHTLAYFHKDLKR